MYLLLIKIFINTVLYFLVKHDFITMKRKIKLIESKELDKLKKA